RLRRHEYWCRCRNRLGCRSFDLRHSLRLNWLGFRDHLLFTACLSPRLQSGELFVALRQVSVPRLPFGVPRRYSVFRTRLNSVDSRILFFHFSLLASARFSRFMRSVVGCSLRSTYFFRVYRAAPFCLWERRLLAQDCTAARRRRSRFLS